MNQLNRKEAPEFRAIENITLLRPTHTRLDNGCNIYCFDSGDQDLVRIEWIFGNLHFNPEKPLLNVAANTMLSDGTAKLTAAQIADGIDFYGAFLQTDFGVDNSQVTLFSLTRHLPQTLPVIKDIITGSVYPEKELETYIRNHQQKLQVSLQKNDVVARRLFNKAIFGETLYGFSPEVETFNTLDRDGLLAHFKRKYTPSNCTIIIAGKVGQDTLDLLIDFFGKDWTDGDVKADLGQPQLKPAAEHFYFSEKADALQSAIRIGAPSINRTHADFPALSVLNTVLGGYFGSRLMANIREDKGYTYGIGSGINSLKQGGAFFIATEVGADVCKAAIGEVEKELKLLQDELIPEEELSLVRNFMMGSLLGSLENVFSHADKFKNLYFFGLDYDYYDNYVEIVKTVSAEQLQKLAGEYLNFDKFYKVIAGKY